MRVLFDLVEQDSGQKVEVVETAFSSPAKQRGSALGLLALLNAAPRSRIVLLMHLITTLRHWLLTSALREAVVAPFSLRYPSLPV